MICVFQKNSIKNFFFLRFLWIQVFFFRILPDPINTFILRSSLPTDTSGVYGEGHGFPENVYNHFFSIMNVAPNRTKCKIWNPLPVKPSTGSFFNWPVPKVNFYLYAIDRYHGIYRPRLRQRKVKIIMIAVYPSTYADKLSRRPSGPIALWITRIELGARCSPTITFISVLSDLRVLLSSSSSSSSTSSTIFLFVINCTIRPIHDPEVEIDR